MFIFIHFTFLPPEPLWRIGYIFDVTGLIVISNCFVVFSYHYGKSSNKNIIMYKNFKKQEAVLWFIKLHLNLLKLYWILKFNSQIMPLYNCIIFVINHDKNRFFEWIRVQQKCWTKKNFFLGNNSKQNYKMIYS